jgi:RimJ/RimL family protein N-acetyltransferase
MRHDTLGRPLGEEVTGWDGALAPRPTICAGRFCRIEPFSAATHGPSLRAALEADGHDANWAYLTPKPAGEEAWRAWMAGKEDSRDPMAVAIVEVDSGRAVGTASYMRIDAGNGVIEIGWVQFSSCLQRTPAATEALYLMIRQCFGWGYRRCEWKSNSLNAASLRAAERLGFTYEGTFRQARVNWGLNRDTAWFSLLDHEWPRCRAALEAWLSPENFDAQGRQLERLQALRQRL